MDVRQTFKNALLDIDRITAREILSANPLDQQIDHVMVPVLEEIGEEWNRGELALSQIYMSGKICEELIDQLTGNREVMKQNLPPVGICVLLDHHALGKRVLYSVLKASGYSVIDLGAGLSPEEVVQQVQKHNINILMISTLMLKAALMVKELMPQLKKIDSDIQVVVGGAPFRFDPELWRRVGADHFGYHATDAPKIIAAITGGDHEG